MLPLGSMINVSCLKFLLAAFIGLMSIVTSAQNPEGFDEMLKSTYEGSVPLIFADSVAAISGAENWMIVDARELEEYEVSHLSNALFVGYKNFSPEKLGEWPKESNIVVYCSVGYRSERVGEILLRSGFQNVYNLRGGIFEWVNTGYSVVDEAGKQVKKIHPYNENWGKWVINYEKVYE